MESIARLRYLRVSARKARLVADTVRGQNVGVAVDTLSVLVKKSAPFIKQLIKSAISNADNKGKVDLDNLYVKSICVDSGPFYKRFIPRAQGRATVVRKRTSHITVILDEK